MTPPDDEAPDGIAGTSADGEDVGRVLALLSALDREMAVAPIAGAVGHLRGGEEAVQRGREALWGAIRELDARRVRLQRAVEEVDALELSFHYNRTFGDAAWPSRRAQLAALLVEDPPAGVRAWLAAWAGAALVGRYDEADRLVSAGLEVPAELGWLGDRLAGVLDAMRTGLTSTDEPAWLAAGLRRSENVLAFLAEGAAVGGEAALADDGRRQAALLLAQWTAAAGEGPEPALALAEELGATAAELLVVRAMAATAPEERVRLAREALAADGDLIPAMVVLAQAASEDTRIDCDRVVAELAHIEGLIPFLDALPVQVPGPVWLALARRAAAEDHGDAVELLDRAMVGSGPATAGEARRLRADLRARRGAPPEEVADLLEQAATTLIPVDAVRARELYERVLVLAPGHEGASLGLADAIRLLTWPQTLQQARPQVERGLDLLASTHQLHGVRADTAWSLLVESGLRSKLAEGMGRVSRMENWKAVAAVSRALVYMPRAAHAWTSLSSVLSELDAATASAAAAEAALGLDPTSASARDEWVKALAIIGDERVLPQIDAMPEDQRTPWHLGVLAYTLLRDDPVRAHQAAQRAVQGESTNPWLRWLLATAATLAGADEAETQWRWLWRESPRENTSQLHRVALACVELGYYEDARELCKEVLRNGMSTVDDGVAGVTLGVARLLLADPGGVGDIATGIAQAPTRRYLEDHRQWTLQRLPGLAASAGVSLPDLAEVETALERRAGELVPVAPDVEILEIGERTAASATAEEDGASATRARNAARMAAARWRIHTGRGPEAADLLRELRAAEPDVPEHGMALAEAEAAPQGSEPPALPADTSGAPAPPADTSADTGEPAAKEIELLLPDEWFEGLTDPSTQHEVLTRHLPDARARLARMGITLPAVRVHAMEELGGAEFAIVIDGELRIRSAVEQGRWTCRRAWLPCLPAGLQAEATDVDGADDVVSFPAPADPAPLVRLVAWSPAEVVVRVLVALAGDVLA